MNHTAAVAAFEDLGLTRVEAEVYVFLVQNSPATGYTIASAIDRTKGATYKVLGSLADKGAVLLDDGQSRLARAVPPEEFLAHLERGHRSRRQAAADAARDLKCSPGDSRIYQLTNTDQTYERVRRMLAEAQERVLLEITPGALEELRTDLETAATRLQIAARVYVETDLPGIDLIVSPYGEELAERWGAQWLSVFVDGRQFLFAELTGDGRDVVQAVWTRSAFLSAAVYGYVNSDLHHYAFRPALLGAQSLDEVRAEYGRLQERFPVGGDLGWRSQVDPEPPAPS